MLYCSNDLGEHRGHLCLAEIFTDGSLGIIWSLGLLGGPT